MDDQNWIRKVITAHILGLREYFQSLSSLDWHGSGDMFDGNLSFWNIRSIGIGSFEI